MNPPSWLLVLLEGRLSSRSLDDPADRAAVAQTLTDVGMMLSPEEVEAFQRLRDECHRLLEAKLEYMPHAMAALDRLISLYAPRAPHR